MSLGPFDLAGGPFLQLYGILFGIAIIAGFVIPRWLRPDGSAGRVTETGELAFLAGGATRFADAVVARLLATGALVMIGRKGFHAQSRDAGRTAAERSVLALPGELSWPKIARTLKPKAEPIGRRLIADGLMMDAGLILQMRFWQALPYFLLLAFGLVKLMIGEARHRPVGYLMMFLFVTVILALIRWFSIDRLTRGGHAALADARAGAERLKRAPTSTETDLAVALFGTVVLVGSGWAGFHQLRSPSSSDSSSTGDGGSSSGDGGGGCGGGGCGGCGS
ncbi:MAG: TIGR04222 domain-containing membrane protein [Sphingomonas bacterium]